MKSKFALIMCLLAQVLLNAQTESKLDINPSLIPFLDKSMAPFYHGVASGDPTQNSIIIWTKLTLPISRNKLHPIEVKWEISDDEQFKNMVDSGIIKANDFVDYSFKTDVQGLKENTKYYYRFAYGNSYSIVGQTRTLPADPSKFTIAFASCSNYEWGYFNNYGAMANDQDIDLVVHLGDYIYEYGQGGYGDTTIGRYHLPNKEITTLDDYRTRYSQYRLDKDLIKLHQMKPFITTWDDHEIANNGYIDGAQNHQPDKEGDWQSRKTIGKKVYYEWMPVRDNEYHELYRSFKLGSLMELIILDTRIAGRTKQVDNENNAQFNDSSRTILGTKQYTWLLEKLRDKTTNWKIIGNQVPFGPMYQPDFKGKADKYMDGWDGYPFERSKLIKTIDLEKLKNIVWVTGDYHCSFAFENDLNGTMATNDNISVEFVVTSITSANDDEGMDRNKAIDAQKDYIKFNPHCKYVNNVDNGYLVVKIEKEKITSTFYYADTVKKPSSKIRKEKSFIVKKDSPVLIEEK